MFRRTIILITLLGILSAKLLCAQSPVDTLRLDAVDITARQTVRQTPGATSTAVDSSAIHASCTDAAELLRMNTNAFIKTYSYGGSATLSVRGTEARHTAVLWHGFNINSPTMGVMDVSLVPLTGINTIKLIQGGVTSVYGNASLGGTLLLENAMPSFSNSITCAGGAAGGSFETWNAFGSVNLSGNKLQSVTGFRWLGSENDFSYTDITKSEKPIIEQQHGEVTGLHLTQDFYFKTGNSGFITASAWFVNESRQIPPTMMEDYSAAEQKDSIIRTVVSWKNHFKNLVTEISGAYFDEYQHYQDPKHQIDSKYQVKTWQANGSASFSASEKLEFLAGVNYTNNIADFEEYSNAQTRILLTLYGGVTYSPIEIIRLALNFRKEFSELENPPFCPSIHLEADVIKNLLSFHASASKNYSLPSMNDLYWQPGGNKDLLPEESLAMEFGIKLFRDTPTKPELTATLYRAVTQNWIKWTPADGGYYTSSNIDEVETKGVELQGTYQYSVRKTTLQIHAGYAYTIATRSETSPGQEALLGRQLIYTPRHSAVINAGIIQGEWEFRYDHQFTGLRYTTEDNTASVEAFNTADLRISRNIPAGKMLCSVYLKAMNLWDQQYQVIAWRPMPGRWLMAGITLQYKGKLK